MLFIQSLIRIKKTKTHIRTQTHVINIFSTRHNIWVRTRAQKTLTTSLLLIGQLIRPLSRRHFTARYFLQNI